MNLISKELLSATLDIYCSNSVSHATQLILVDYYFSDNPRFHDTINTIIDNNHNHSLYYFYTHILEEEHEAKLSLINQAANL